MALRFPHKFTPLSLIVLAATTAVCYLYLPVLFQPAAVVSVLFVQLALYPMLRNFPLAKLLRGLLYVAAFFLPLFLGFDLLPLRVPPDPWLIPLVFAALAIPLSFRIRDVQTALDPALLPYLPPIWRSGLVTRLWYAYGVAAGEELFFRGYLLPAVLPMLGWSAHLVVMVIFVWEHWFGHYQDNFKPRDYLSIALLSVTTSGLTVYSNSLLPALMVHLLFNTPTALHYVLRYRLYISNRLISEEGKVTHETSH